MAGEPSCRSRLGHPRSPIGYWQTATKIGTGFSEQQLVELYNLLKPLELTVKRGDVLADPSKPPDVWFEPKVVMEVLCADLSLSP